MVGRAWCKSGLDMMDEPQTDAMNWEPQRRSDGTFAKGGPGRPKGSRNKRNRDTLDAIADLSPQAIVVLREHLTQNNLKAATYVLDRFLPSERLIELPSSEPNAWADALAEGSVTPGEAAKASGALRAISDATIVKDLQARLDELEAKFGLGGSA